MASQQRVEWAKLKTGILATIAMIIAAVLIFLLTGNGTLFERQALIKTFMADSAGMAQNAPVRLNGILVGHIKKVMLSGSTVPRRTVEVDLVMPEKYLAEIPINSEAAISAANLLGDKYINITRGTDKRHVEDGGEIASLQTQDVPEILAQSSSLLSQFQTILGRLDGLLTGVENGQGNLGKLFKDDSLYDRLNATAGEVEQLVKDVHNSNGTVSHLLYDPAFYDDIRRPIQRLDDMLASVQQQKGTVGKLLYDPQIHDEALGTITDARADIAEAKKLVDDLNAGKGTAGKFLKDEDIYNQLDLISKKINTTMDKINSGQGTIGQLMTNPKLYDSLTSTSTEMTTVLKNFEANPKKFLTIRLVLLIRLIFNADDFGFTRDVNEGIVEAHRHGVLTATTLMANGDAFDHAVACARDTPSLDIGVHLAMVQGRSVARPGHAMPATLQALALALLRGQVPVYEEAAAQVRKIIAAGIRPSHIDTHKHTHLFPPVLKAVVRVAKEFDIPWVRQRLGIRLKGLRTTDHFTGFRDTGSLDEASMIRTLENLPDGLTEFMCHPGKCGPELQGAATRLKESRAVELAALTSPEVRRVIERRGIMLTDYRSA